MRSLHEAIVAARSPEERLAVLERHRALMRDGFAHSHGGRDGGCPHHAEATPSSSLR